MWPPWGLPSFWAAHLSCHRKHLSWSMNCPTMKALCRVWRQKGQESHCRSGGAGGGRKARRGGKAGEDGIPVPGMALNSVVPEQCLRWPDEWPEAFQCSLPVFMVHTSLHTEKLGEGTKCHTKAGLLSVHSSQSFCQ